MEIAGTRPRGSATEAQYRSVFDRLFDRASERILSGSHYRDTPPIEGGRWGPSVVFVPDASSSEGLAAITDQAIALTGPGHWRTGAPAAVHFTVRAIEAHRVDVPPADPVTSRASAAMARAAAAATTVRFRLSGLTLTPSGVMACAYPDDGAADHFASRLRDELGADAWFEANFHRDIWYATVVHFAGDLVDPAGLVAWVNDRRDLDLGVAIVDEVELIRFRYDGHHVVRVPMTSAPLRTGEG